MPAGCFGAVRSIETLVRTPDASPALPAPVIPVQPSHAEFHSLPPTPSLPVFAPLAPSLLANSHPRAEREKLPNAAPNGVRTLTPDCSSTPQPRHSLLTLATSSLSALPAPAASQPEGERERVTWRGCTAWLVRDRRVHGARAAGSPLDS